MLSAWHPRNMAACVMPLGCAGAAARPNACTPYVGRRMATPYPIRAPDPAMPSPPANSGATHEPERQHLRFGRSSLEKVKKDLADISATLASLARKHRNILMVGRSNLQQGVPMTFGYKCAVWLAGIERHREWLQQLRPRVLVGEFGGAVGTLASIGEMGLRVNSGGRDRSPGQGEYWLAGSRRAAAHTRDRVRRPSSVERAVVARCSRPPSQPRPGIPGWPTTLLGISRHLKCIRFSSKKGLQCLDRS